MRIRVTLTCEYDVVDDPVRRAEAYDGKTSDEEILAMEAELADDDPGYLLGLSENWTINAERA